MDDFFWNTVHVCGVCVWCVCVLFWRSFALCCRCWRMWCCMRCWLHSTTSSQTWCTECLRRRNYSTSQYISNRKRYALDLGLGGGGGGGGRGRRWGMKEGEEVRDEGGRGGEGWRKERRWACPLLHDGGILSNVEWWKVNYFSLFSQYNFLQSSYWRKKMIDTLKNLISTVLDWLVEKIQEANYTHMDHIFDDFLPIEIR